MKAYHLPFLVFLLLSAVTGVSCASQEDERTSRMTSPEQESKVEQFSCTLAAKDAASCAATTADDGTQCVWCSLTGLGFCVSETQAKAMEKVIPTIKCEDSPKTDDSVHAPPTPAPTQQADPNTDVWKCLQQSEEAGCKKAAATSSCKWCTNKVGYGLCLAPVEADFASQSKWYHCAKEDEDEDDLDNKDVAQQQVEAFDTSCLVASIQQDASFCQATEDATSGQSCKWCHVTSAPSLRLCMSAEQAKSASVYVSCESTSMNVVARRPSFKQRAKKEIAVEDPFDISCVEASMIQDETVCESTTDVSGQACEWCSIPRVPYHVCLSKDQANLVSGIVICSKPPEEETSVTVATARKATRGSSSASASVKNSLDFNFDIVCLAQSLKQDAASCQAVTDMNEHHCKWCHVTEAPTIRLCLSEDQATTATGLMSCDTSLDSKKVDEVQDPTDLTCLEASLLQDESVCESTSDTNGQACEWCSVSNLPFSLCLSEEQASLVAGFVTCSTGPSSAPAKAVAATTIATPATNVDFPANLIKCLETLDEESCEKKSCSWCDTQIGFGVCLAKEAAAATDNCPFFDCKVKHQHQQQLALEADDDKYIKTVATSSETGSPDVNCWAAGMASNDAQSVCQTTKDHQGSTCVWCDAAGSGFGLCLSQEQAKIAGKWLQCDSSSSTSNIDDVSAIKN